MSRSWIVDAVGRDAYERLASRLPGTELWSVLMEVARERARKRTPAEVLAQWQRDGFVRPAPIDQRTFVDLDAHLLAAAAAFEAIELSPVAPLATCSAVALTDQHRVLSSLRGTEVVSDPTNVLALECATRLRRDPAGIVRLTTSQRVVRAQAVPKKPGFAQHFRIFVLVSAGRERKDHGFVADALVEHVRVLLSALDRLEGHGYAFARRRVDVLATENLGHVADRIAAAIAGPAVERRRLEHAYYSGGVRFMLWATAPDGAEIPLGDGGAFDWVGKLTSNAKNAFVASGIGAQIIPVLFRAPAG